MKEKRQQILKMKYRNNNILITGASSGLGRELSLHFDQKVNKLFCVGQNKKKINDLKRQTKNPKHFFFSGDLSIDKDIKKLIKSLKKKNIDIIIHCMGGGLGLKKDLLPKKDFEKLLSVNLLAQSEINNFLIKDMLKRKIKGKILHVSSIAGIESIASIGYSIAKAALIVYSKKLASLFLKKNIFVKTLILGAFETKDNSFGRLKIINKKAYINFKNKRLIRKKFATINELMPTIDYLLSTDSDIISGTDVVADFSESNSFRI